MSIAPPLTPDVVDDGLSTVNPPAPKFVRRLLGRKIALVCLAYLVAVTAVAIVAPFVLPEVANQHAGDLLTVRAGPSSHHLLGTDTLGRDVLNRLLVGSRITLIGVAEALVVALALGVPLGLVAGFFGGPADRAVGWLADLTFSMPAIVIILLVLSIFPQSMLAGMVTLGVLAAPGLMRVVRSAVLPVKEELYVAAARVSGLTRRYIITRHVLPRIAGPIIVQASLIAAIALVVQTGLAFLGLIVAEPAPSWGGMVADGVTVILQQPWLIWPPGILIAVTIIALGLLGDTTRDATTEAWAPTIRRTHKLRRPTTYRGHVDLRSEPPSLLRIENLSVSFATPVGRSVVVEGLTLDINPGETVGLVGESGCGKTVTAMSIIGLLTGTGQIDSGRIIFNGRDLAALPERALRRIRGKEIGLVSQEPMIGLDPAFRVGSQLAEIVRSHQHLSRKAARARTLELLELVHLRDPAGVSRRYPHELSGGMAQRVAIARALAGEPKLLIADEPTTALDVTVQAEILDLLRELSDARGMAILLVTHDWGVVADICDRAIVMYAGEIVERAGLRALFRDPQHPYTEALLRSNPQNALGSATLPAIPGSVPAPEAWPTGCHFHPRCAYVTAECRQQAVPLIQLTPDRETRCIHHDRVGASRECRRDASTSRTASRT